MGVTLGTSGFCGFGFSSLLFVTEYPVMHPMVHPRFVGLRLCLLAFWAAVAEDFCVGQSLHVTAAMIPQELSAHIIVAL